MSHTGDDFEFDEGDVGPGYFDAADHSVREGIIGYSTGLVLAAGLTVASFLVAGTDLVWAPGIPVLLGVLAVAQIGVHLAFFLHITTAPDNTNTVMALFFGILIVVLVIGGSLWIMNWLDVRMMPTMNQIMQMQR